MALIKPQFEAGRDKIGKKGVVRDKAVHEEVIRKIIDYVYMIGFDVLSLDYSPIKGPEGNIEYLLHIRKDSESDGTQKLPFEIADVVENSHQALSHK